MAWEKITVEAKATQTTWQGGDKTVFRHVTDTLLTMIFEHQTDHNETKRVKLGSEVKLVLNMKPVF